MHHQLHDDLLTKQRHYLRQLLARNQLFAQIFFTLTSDQINLFLASFQKANLKQSTTLQLKTGILYYFITEGIIVRKKSPKDLIKTITKPLYKKKNINNLTQSKNGFFPSQAISKGSTTPIQSFFQPSKRVFGLFTPSHQEPIILKVSAQSCPSVMPTLKNYFNSKIKFLNKFDIFKHFCLNQMQACLHHFKFCKFTFNEIIYSKKESAEFIFFILDGQTIIKQKKSGKSLILKAPNMIGFQRQSTDQQVKCITQSCIAYKISAHTLKQLLLKQEENNVLNEEISISARKQYLKAREDNHWMDQSEKQGNQSKTPCSEKNSVTKSDKRHRRYGGSTISESKKNKLKEYFSNFMNEQYEQYAIKKSNGIDFCEQQPILYQIKPLVSKFPDFSEMNARLKNMRIRKILDGKNVIRKTKSSEQIIFLNTCSASKQNIFSNDRLNHKAKKEIEAKICAKIYKKNPYLFIKGFQ